MRKIFLLLSCVFLAVLIISGCTPTHTVKEPTPIKVTIAGQEIPTVTAKNKWNGGIIDRADTFQTIMKGGTSNIPYIAIDSGAEVVFQGTAPDHFTVTDILINETGDRVYDAKVDSSVPFKAKNQKYTFTVTKNWASLLSSQYADGKKDLRGYRMIASWGANECEYAFVIQTDAY